MKLFLIFFAPFLFFGFCTVLSASSFITKNNIEIYYQTFGNGNPLIVLNGGPGRSSETFIDLAQKLSSSKRKVILFDQRGTGQSKVKMINEKTIALDLMIEDLESLRKHLGYEKISLLGHSFGGMYAMGYAAKYPQNIKHLILSASGAINIKSMNHVTDNIKRRLNPKALKEFLFWTNPNEIKKDPTRAKLEVLRITAPVYVYQKKFIPVVEKNLTDLKNYNPHVNKLIWKSMATYNLTDAFKNFKVPTLIIDCEQDFLGKDIPAEIHRNFPGSEFRIIPQCSHYPWLDSPKEYFSLIDKFLLNNSI